MSLVLTPEEGFVLSRLDVALSTSEVSALTGLPEQRAEEILTRLARLGAIRTGGGDAEAEGAAASEAVADPGEAAPADAESGEATAGEEEVLRDDPAGEEPDEITKEAGEAGFRRIYESRFRGTEQGVRIQAARTAADAELTALGLDPDPLVLTAVLDNPKCGLVQARFAARWHGTAAGLDQICQRPALFADAQLQRLLLRNVHLSELGTKKVLSGKRMLDAYKVSIDSDVPERARAFARGILRSKFGTAQGEERAGIISATEGRVLAALTGLTLDGRATSILCARTYTSALFVQNLARFGSCPPPLLAHLLKQPIVRRQQHLKNMLLQHPNTPADAKRRM